MKKKVIPLLLISSILLIMVACVDKGKQDIAEQNPYQLDNEIMTMERLDDGRMVIVVDTQYNVSTIDIERVIENQFPDVNVVLRLQNTTDPWYLTRKSLENKGLGDIFFCMVGLEKEEELLEKYFMDLSDAPFISNYYQNALDRVAVQGKIYMLPGFSDTFGIIYDRTLFEELGLELPQGRDEFINLCKTIEERKGYQAFMPTLRFGRMAMLLGHAFHYEQVIAGIENQKWLQKYRKGEASFSKHMEPLFKGMKELYNAGVLTEKNFEIEPGIRSAMLYKEYTTAMTMETQNAATYAATAETEHEYGMMPFWNGNDPDSDYVVSASGFNIYVNKRLESPENADKLDKIMEILEYISTPEGQQTLMNKESTTISNVKGTDSISGGEFMSGVADTIAKGNIFREIRYTDLESNNPFQVAFKEALMGYLDGSMTMEMAMSHCDEAMIKIQKEENVKENVYGEAIENFTVLETSEFVADILREEAGADIALILAKQLPYGETGNFFQGDITDKALNFVTLDYISGKDPTYNKLVTIDLTGEQLLEILNYPYLNIVTINNPSIWVENISPSYWVPSNLKLEYAPLLTEGNILSVKNMDNSNFDLEKTYKVAIWNGCFSNLGKIEYFKKETLAAMADVTYVSEQSSVELIKKAVQKAKTIAPPDDGRFIIRWDVTE